ncbi:MAG: flagellar protein FliS [Candidatus Sumerlaeota bacterium]|nr:flagellar protein FliS [Candidatus Sumerlaeota bacterium]
MTYYSRQYLSTQINTASGRRLIVYLFDGVEGHLTQALEELLAERFGPCGKHVSAAMDILIELAAALDFEASPALARRLLALYNYLIETLATTLTARDPKQLRACLGVLSTLADAWRHVSAAAAPPPASKAGAPAPARRDTAVAVAV